MRRRRRGDDWTPRPGNIVGLHTQMGVLHRIKASFGLTFITACSLSGKAREFFTEDLGAHAGFAARSYKLDPTCVGCIAEER